MQFSPLLPVVGAAYMVEYLRRYRERDKLAVQLEQKLAHMQLDALRMRVTDLETKVGGGPGTIPVDGA